jgi:hypothetical protein
MAGPTLSTLSVRSTVTVPIAESTAVTAGSVGDVDGTVVSVTSRLSVPI